MTHPSSTQQSLFGRAGHQITQHVDPNAPRSIGNGTIRVTKAQVVTLPTQDWELVRAAMRASDDRHGLYWVADLPAVRRALGMESEDPAPDPASLITKITNSGVVIREANPDAPKPADYLKA
jgi:hypothetical protein